MLQSYGFGPNGKEIPMIDQANERRNCVRMLVHLPVHFGKEIPKFSGVIDCLSFGGARIRSSLTFSKDSFLYFKVNNPTQREEFEGKGRVVWSQDKDCMGIQFLELPLTATLRLEKILTPSTAGLDQADPWG